MAVVLADLLKERHVLLELSARAQDDALREIVMTMRGEVGDDALEKFLAEVLARENSLTTFVGNGVAFPHARTDLVTEIVLGIGRSADGVSFGKGGERAHLIFVIGVPQRMVSDYLVCVGALARLTRAEETRAALMQTPSTTEFVELLRAGSLELE